MVFGGRMGRVLEGLMVKLDVAVTCEWQEQLKGMLVLPSHQPLFWIHSTRSRVAETASRLSLMNAETQCRCKPIGLCFCEITMLCAQDCTALPLTEADIENAEDGLHVCGGAWEAS